MTEYLNDPAAIMRRSFAMIEAEVDFDGWPEPLRPIAARVIHACGMPDVIDDLVIDERLPAAVKEALRDGRPVLCDAEMTRAGLIRRLLPAGVDVICTLNEPETAHLARARGITRSAAAAERWRDRLEGAVCVIGNAPTALFTLLRLLEEGAPMPAAIIAFPVGFIGAAESKRALIEAAPCPIATLRGRRGGAGMAAAAFNAIIAGTRTP